MTEGFEVPISRYLYTWSESAFIIDASYFLASSNARDDLPIAVEPRITNIFGLFALL